MGRGVFSIRRGSALTAKVSIVFLSQYKQYMERRKKDD